MQSGIPYVRLLDSAPLHPGYTRVVHLLHSDRILAPRPLTKQDLLRLLAHLLAQFATDGKAALDPRPRLHGFEPALEVGKLTEILAHTLIRHDPRPRHHVGDRVRAGEILPVR